MGWSEADLTASSDDFVYYASQVLRWDAEKQREDNKETAEGGRRNEPQRIPLRPPPGTPERIEVPDDTPWTGPQLGPVVRAWEP